MKCQFTMFVYNHVYNLKMVDLRKEQRSKQNQMKKHIVFSAVNEVIRDELTTGLVDGINIDLYLTTVLFWVFCFSLFKLGSIA